MRATRSRGRRCWRAWAWAWAAWRRGGVVGRGGRSGRAGGSGGGVAGWARPSTWAWTRALGQPQALGPAREDGQRPGSGSTLAHQAILASAAVRRAVPDVYPITCRPGQDAREHWKTPRKGSKVPAVGRPWNRWTRSLDERRALQSQDKRCNNGDESVMGAPRRRRRCSVLLYRADSTHRRSRGSCGRPSGTDKPDVDLRASAACQPVAARFVLSVAKRPTSRPKISRAQTTAHL
jgi:hypothetical protein